MLSQNDRRTVSSLALLLLIAFTPEPTFAFKPDDKGHIGITKAGLNKVAFFSPTEKKELHFSEAAKTEIVESNIEVDLSESFFDASAHCDDETLDKCSKRVLENRKQVVAILRSNTGNGRAARSTLGQALHTIQDFYAHSNWTQDPGLKQKGVNMILGNAELTRLATNQVTCKNGGYLRGNYQLTGDGLTQLTTGYFQIGTIPPNKCNHGLLMNGINQDTSDKPFYDEARKAAVEATYIYVTQILKDLENNERAIRALLDRQ